MKIDLSTIKNRLAGAWIATIRQALDAMPAKRVA